MGEGNDTLALILRKLDQLHDKIDALAPATKQRLSVKEAAAFVGCSTDTIRRALNCRELRFSQSKPGAAQRIAASDLESWLKRQTINPLRKSS